jgi:hypothetical protein
VWPGNPGHIIEKEPNMRNPSPHIVQRQENECETMCTAQALYMHNMLELPEVGKLGKRIGQKPGEFDLRAGNIRLLFEAGFRIVEIDRIDLRRLVASRSYARQCWIDDGYSEQEIEQVLFPQIYPKIRERASYKLRHIHCYASQYTRKLRPGTVSDLNAMLARRWQVFCWLQQGGGTTHQILILRASKNEYQLFNPNPSAGIYWLNKELVANIVLPSFVGFYLPGPR